MAKEQFTLHKAILANDDDAVRASIVAELDVDEISSEGWSPLHLSAQMNNINAARWLINSGAKVNAKNDNAVTPLHSCAWANALEIAMLLMKNGANVNAKDSLQWTPLMLAAWSNHDDIIDMLIKNGASINARNRNDSTSLHLAAYNNCPLALQRLLEYKANVNIQNKDGMVPIDVAVKRKNTECEEILSRAKSRRRATGKSVATPIRVQQSNYIDKSVDIAAQTIDEAEGKPVDVADQMKGKAEAKVDRSSQKQSPINEATKEKQATTAPQRQQPMPEPPPVVKSLAVGGAQPSKKEVYNRDAYFLFDKPEQDMPFLTELTKERAKLSSDGHQDAPLFPEQLINITLAGDKVRRKSEVVIANLLFSLDINYVYERKLCGTVAVGINYPAFTVFTADDRIIIWEHISALETPEKKKQFDLLKRWYGHNGFKENNNIFVSQDTPEGGIDSQSIWQVAEKINALVESSAESAS